MVQSGQLTIAFTVKRMYFLLKTSADIRIKWTLVLHKWCGVRFRHSAKNAWIRSHILPYWDRLLPYKGIRRPYTGIYGIVFRRFSGSERDSTVSAKILKLHNSNNHSYLFHSDDGICRDIKKPPVGLFPFRKETGGENIYGDSDTEAEIVGVSYADDIDEKIEYAVKFDGTPASYIEIPRNSKLDAAQDISIVMNIFPEGDEGELFSYKVTGGGVQMSQREGTKEGHSVLSVRFVKRTLLLVDDLTAECLEHGKWNHITATYKYETGEACLFKDGELVKKLNVGRNYIATQFAIRVGALENSVAPFQGRISCLQIYNYALELEDVKQSQYVCRKSK